MNYIKVAQFNIKNISSIIYMISYYKYTHVKDRVLHEHLNYLSIKVSINLAFRLSRGAKIEKKYSIFY
jgi:hypothetical protein